MTLIPSGINYVGNKWRMLSTLIDNLDLSRKTFVDVFCGSGVVGINVTNYYDRIIMNDGCWQLAEILNAMQCDGNFIENVERVIEAYNLGKDNNVFEGTEDSVSALRNFIQENAPSIKFKQSSTPTRLVIDTEKSKYLEDFKQ